MPPGGWTVRRTHAAVAGEDLVLRDSRVAGEVPDHADLLTRIPLPLQAIQRQVGITTRSADPATGAMLLIGGDGANGLT